MFVIKCVGLASGKPCDTFNQYLTDYDPDYSNGIGLTRWTRDIKNAWVTPTKDHALDVILTISNARPLRDDGNPNRPLTAFSVVIEEVANPKQEAFWGKDY